MKKCYKCKEIKDLDQYAHLKSKYGITTNDLNDMLTVQDNKCAICDREFDKKNVPCVDHDHSTNDVRSLLCRSCNRALGYFQDDPKLCRTASIYLEIHRNLSLTKRTNRDTVGTDGKEKQNSK